jgi:hypothetical protein
MKTLPKLWQRNIGGKLIGAFHVTIKGTRINLGTKDASEALKRRKLAMAGRRKFKDDIEGAAEATIAALDGTAGAQSPAVVDAGAATETPATSTAPTAPPPQLPPVLPELAPAPAVNQQAPSDWAAAANTAAAEVPSDASLPGGDGSAGAALPKVKFGELPFLKGAFVTLSKMAVTVQVALQAWAARVIGDVEVGRVGPPAEQLTPEEFAAQAANAKPWDADDPREQGRQIWEECFKRICPDDFDVPDWLLAPMVVAMFTLPVQIAGAKKIDHSKDPPKPEAPADEARAAA